MGSRNSPSIVPGGKQKVCIELEVGLWLGSRRLEGHRGLLPLSVNLCFWTLCALPFHCLSPNPFSQCLQIGSAQVQSRLSRILCMSKSSCGCLQAWAEWSSEFFFCPRAEMSSVAATGRKWLLSI